MDIIVLLSINKASLLYFTWIIRHETSCGFCFHATVYTPQFVRLQRSGMRYRVILNVHD